MQAAASALPMPESGPSLTAKWIKANAIVAAVYAAAAAVTFATDKMLGIGEPATGMLSKGTGGAIALFGTVIPLMMYAMLTGAVLGEKLPAMSQRAWMRLHLIVGLVVGAFLAMAYLVMPEPAEPVTPTISNAMIIAGIVIILVVGPLVGAVMGALQAIVLRRAASGMGAWILGSMAASTFMLAAMLIAAFGIGGNGKAIGQFVAMETTVFVAMVVSALVMLPALQRLRPR